MSEFSVEEFRKAVEEIDRIVARDPQLMFRKDREAARQEDIKERRGFLVLSPELQIVKELDPEGMILEKDGQEYRVIVDPRLVGMTSSATGEPIHGWWVPPIAMDIKPMGPFTVLDGDRKD